MRKFFVLILFFAAACVNGQQTIHDKDARLREVGDFHAIEVTSAIDLRLSQGSENVVAVSAVTEEDRAGIRTEVRNGVLRISYEQKKWFRNGGKIRVYVAAKTLKKVDASGACDVVVSGELNVDELALEMSGASDFRGAVSGGSLAVKISGASDVSVQGTVKNLNVDASGASHFKGYEMLTDNCLVEASGASDIRVTVNKVLNAKASGASSIRYQGDGMISDVKTSGASTISRKG